MYVLKRNRFYKIEAAALEGTVNASGKKLTVKRIKKHFTKLDKKRKQRANVMELSAGHMRTNNQQRNVVRPFARRAQAWAAQAGHNSLNRAPTPTMSNVSSDRRPRDTWTGKQRVAVMRLLNRPPLPNRNGFGNMSKGGQGRGVPSNVRCYACNEMGHLASNCPT